MRAPWLSRARYGFRSARRLAASPLPRPPVSQRLQWTRLCLPGGARPTARKRGTATPTRSLVLTYFLHVVLVRRSDRFVLLNRPRRLHRLRQPALQLPHRRLAPHRFRVGYPWPGVQLRRRAALPPIFDVLRIEHLERF